jgi:GST-like protein
VIKLYTTTTANGYRASIMLEECGLPYTYEYIKHREGQTLTPEFIKLSPLSAVPVIVDPDGPGGKPLTLAQSAAIALYLAEKSGKFLPRDPAQRWIVMQWLMHVMHDHAGTNTNLVFLPQLPEKPEAAIKQTEQRLLTYFGRVDRRLAESEYLAGDLSVADFCLYPIIARRPHLLEPEGLTHLKRWRAHMAARPGVIKGMQIPAV